MINDISGVFCARYIMILVYHIAPNKFIINWLKLSFMECPIFNYLLQHNKNVRQSFRRSVKGTNPAQKRWIKWLMTFSLFF